MRLAPNAYPRFPLLFDGEASRTGHESVMYTRHANSGETMQVLYKPRGGSMAEGNFIPRLRLAPPRGVRSD